MFRWGGRINLKETELWSNPSPSASFSGQKITLSDSLSNYDFIKVYFNVSPTYNNIIKSVILPISEFMEMTNQTSSTGDLTRAASIMERNGSTYRVRTFYYVSNTEVYFMDFSLISAAGSGSNYLIPTKVSGLKL